MKCSLPLIPADLTLEGGHSGAHYLVHQEQVGGDDGGRVYHLALHVVVVQNAVVGGCDGFACGAVDPDSRAKIPRNRQAMEIGQNKETRDTLNPRGPRTTWGAALIGSYIGVKY